MKLVKENLDFIEDQNPYKAIGVGKYDDNYNWDKPMHNDKIELLEDIYSTEYADSDVLEYNGEKLTTMKKLKENFELKFEKGQIFYFYVEDYSWYPIADDNYPIGHHWIADKNREIFKKLR